MQTSMRALGCSAIVLTGLSAGVALAHLLELPNKMLLSATDYLFVQQRLYEGFGQVLGPIELGASASAIALAVLFRKRRSTFLLAIAAVVLNMFALIVWQVHNGPVNIAVEAWTTNSVPTDWTNWRDRWEYAHATRAILYTLSLGVLSLQDFCLSRSRK